MINIYTNNLIKIVNFSKIFYINLNYLIDLMNNFVFFLYYLNKFNLYFYKEVVNIFYDLKSFKNKKIKTKKYNLYYQKLNTNLYFNNYYNF